MNLEYVQSENSVGFSGVRLGPTFTLEGFVSKQGVHIVQTPAEGIFLEVVGERTCVLASVPRLSWPCRAYTRGVVLPFCIFPFPRVAAAAYRVNHATVQTSTMSSAWVIGLSRGYRRVRVSRGQRRGRRSTRRMSGQQYTPSSELGRGTFSSWG